MIDFKEHPWLTVPQEIAAISLEAKKHDLEADGEMTSDEEVKVTLLAQLQVTQEVEVNKVMEALATEVSYCPCLG